MATATSKHTLEKIADSMGKDFNEDRMHSALLLSFAKSVYSVISNDCVPSPLYRLSYDTKTDRADLDETYGISLPPEDNAVDLSIDNYIFCCNIRDIPLLLEGETGVGKTFAAMKYLKTVFRKDNFFSHRLSANAFTNNLFTHFQEGGDDHGMPIIKPKMDKIDTTAAGVVDEINRGESNETLQFFDNEMHLGGRIYKLGVPIPNFEGGKVIDGSKGKKKLLIICAQNPAGADDAKFTQTMQLDAAVDNRLLKTYVGNAASSAGVTLWLGQNIGKQHERFIDEMKKNISSLLKIDPSSLSDLDRDWISCYSWISKPDTTDKPILYSALELADMMITVFSGDLSKYYEYEKKVVEKWNKKLGTDVHIANKFEETERVKDLYKIVSSFKVPIIFRDIDQIKKIADVLATHRNIEDALSSKTPLKEYLETERFVSAREIAHATLLLARNKQGKDSPSPNDAINQVLTKYVGLVKECMADAKYLSASFDLFDRNAGIQKIMIYKAIKDTLGDSGGVDTLIGKIAGQAKALTAKISISEDVRNVMIARVTGDLMTFCGFLNEYQKDISPILSKKGNKIADVVESISKCYYQKVSDNAMIVPKIYQHRIQRTLGI